ncbi:hypothetical protein BsWGS_26041 [Bradybaena similaris]
MPEIDHDALSTATKALSVIFIVLICTANAILIYVVARSARFMYSPRCLILISLAIGDIFFALFSLVVNARVTFEDARLPFGTTLTATYYQTFFISFVYGVGLIIMAVEIILRHKTVTPFLKRYQIVEAFGFSALPWLLLLVIILPLTLVGVDWETHEVTATTQRVRAMYWVSVLVPAILAVVICLVIIFIKMAPVQKIWQSPDERVVSASYIPHIDQRHSTRNSRETELPQSYKFHGVQQYHQGMPNSQRTLQYSSAAQHPNNHPPDVTFRAPLASTTTCTNPVKEKCGLLFAATIYLICVVPQAAMYVTDIEVSLQVFVILLHTFYWLCNVRSILTPCIWILYSISV